MIERIIKRSALDYENTIKMIKEKAISEGFKIVSEINAQENIKKAGFLVKGNYIIEIFRPDLAYKIIKFKPEDGIFPPLRILVYENENETYVEYIKPSSLLGEYDFSKDLDILFEK